MKINKQRLMQIIREELNEMGMGIGIPDKMPTGPAKNPPKKLPDAFARAVDLIRDQGIQAHQGEGSNFVVDIEEFIINNPEVPDEMIKALYEKHGSGIADLRPGDY